MFYVYKLIDPRDNITFYVGKGKGNRMLRHEQYTLRGELPNGNKNLYNRIQEIKSNNCEIVYEKVSETQDEMLAYEIENRIINEIGIENLCNSICDKVLIGIANNTKSSNWYYNEKTDEYRLFKKDDQIPDGFQKGSPKTKLAMRKWWDSLDQSKLEEYKSKMSESLKNSIRHKEAVSSNEYKENLSQSLRSSKKFQNYCKNRKPRGKYRESEKTRNRRKKSFLLDENSIITKEFNSLSEVCEYFNIKTSTASKWIKEKRKIDGLTLSSI